MLSDDSYNTLEREGRGIYKEKGSRFLSFAIRVSSEDEIKARIEGLRKKFHDATHWCYAYQCGVEKVLFRYNDDGEPAGSAGLPIYNQIRSKGLTNVLIVVVRYYGGKKLGTGGLINAYKTAALAAIEDSPVMTLNLISYFDIRFSYSKLNQVMKILKNFHVTIKHQDIDETCTVNFSTRKRYADAVYHMLLDTQVEIRNKLDEY